MNAKTQRASSTSGSATNLAPFNLLAELPRRQAALVTQTATALFRGSESMRKIQQQTAHRATLQHQEVAARLQGPCDFNELLAIQTELLRFNMQEVAQYWQQLATAVFKIQADMVSGAGEIVLDSAGEPTLDSLQRAFEASLNGAGAPSAAH